MFGDPEDDRASRPATTWSRASARCSSPSRSTPLPAPRPSASTPHSARRSTGTDVDELRGIIDDSGAHAQVEAVIGQLSEHAVEALRAADIDAHARDVLVELAAAATQRSV